MPKQASSEPAAPGEIHPASPGEIKQERGAGGAAKTEKVVIVFDDTPPATPDQVLLKP